MGATAAILSGIQTVTDVLGQRQQANAIEDQADFEAQLAELAAEDAVSRGNLAARQRERQARRTIGAQRAALAANGVDVNSGTAADLQADEAALGALDAQTIRNNAAREAWGYRAQSSIDTRGAKNAAAGIRNQSVSTLLTGATNTYGLFREARGGGRRPGDRRPAGGARLPAGRPYSGDSGYGAGNV